MTKITKTYELITLIGSPFVDKRPNVSFDTLERLYTKAFADRVGLLYLTLQRRNDWPNALEEKYQKLNGRRDRTLEVVASLGLSLNEFSEKDYAIFKWAIFSSQLR